MRALAAWPAVVLVACGGGPLAPEPCGVLDDVTLYAGEQERVTLCFLGDGEPVVDIASSDPEIVDVTYRADTRVVGLFAHTPGEATVTVTARNADAAGEQTFQVIVPNRAPEVAGELPRATMVPGVRRQWDLGALFEEPDDQELQYSATSSDAAVATASVTDHVLTVEARAPGVAEVTATASDGELSSSAMFELEVVPRDVLHQATFDDELDGWTAVTSLGPSSRVRARNGALELWSDDPDQLFAVAGTAQEALYFDIRASLQPGPRDSRTVVALALVLDNPTYPQVEVWLTDANEYVVLAWNTELEDVEQWARAAFDIDVNSFTDVRWWYEDGRYRIEFNNGQTVQQVTVGEPDQTSPLVQEIGLFANYFDEDKLGEENSVRMDEITVRGVAPARRDATTTTWLQLTRKEGETHEK